MNGSSMNRRDIHAIGVVNSTPMTMLNRIDSMGQPSL